MTPHAPGRHLIALPFLVGIGPVLFLWARNAAIVKPADVVLPLTLVTGVTGIALLVLARITGDVARSSITVAIVLVPLLTFGYQLDVLAGGDGLPLELLGKLLVLAVNLGLAAALIAVTWIHDVRRIATFVTLAAAIFAVASVPQIVTATSFASEPERGAQAPVGDGPDVYYIVVDAYARNDVLTEVFGTDTSAFLGTLRDKGFYIADESYSNYSMTFLSLASTLNMTYLAEDAPYDKAGSDRLIANASVVREFQRHGYQYVFFETSYWGTDEAPLADVSLGSEGLGPFQQALARTTLPWRLVEPKRSHLDVLQAFEQLEAVPDNEAPTFTFAHFLVPHPPLMFRADGSIRPYVDDLRHPWDRDAYAEQVQFVNVRLKQVVDVLLEESDQPPIIIIQGDHGSIFTLGRAPAEEVWWERHAILNAILVPEEMRADLYPSISPVNTFRFLLPNLFGGEAQPMLPDRAYFNWYDPSTSDAVRPDPFELRDVTEALP